MPSLHWHSPDVATPWNKTPMGQGSSGLDSQAMAQRCFLTNPGLTCHLLMACKITGSLFHWALMEPLRQSGERAHDVNNICDLECALQAEWVRIPLQVIRKLSCSIRRRCLAVLAANGGHTRYWAVFKFWCLTPSSFHIRLRLNAAKLLNNNDASHWW